MLISFSFCFDSFRCLCGGHCHLESSFTAGDYIMLPGDPQSLFTGGLHQIPNNSVPMELTFAQPIRPCPPRPISSHFDISTCPGQRGCHPHETQDAGISSSYLRQSMEEIHSELWGRRALQYLSDCELHKRGSRLVTTVTVYRPPPAYRPVPLAQWFEMVRWQRDPSACAGDARAHHLHLWENSQVGLHQENHQEAGWWHWWHCCLDGCQM